MFFVGCLLLGLGLGFLFDELVAGLFIGLGAGFILEGFFNELKKPARRMWRDRQDQP